MTSSSDNSIERGLDTMIVVYSMLNGHPASAVCGDFIAARSGWFTSIVTLLEIRAVMLKVYDVDAVSLSQKLSEFTSGPIWIAEIDAVDVITADRFANAFSLDLTDALLISCARGQGVARLATDDQKLIRVCDQIGMTVENPIDDDLRRQIAEWETANLAVKGLPRILRRVHRWLNAAHPQLANDFWSQTGNGSHLP
jgi:predicted nucleic acid-binding protein